MRNGGTQIKKEKLEKKRLQKERLEKKTLKEATLSFQAENFSEALKKLNQIIENNYFHRDAHNLCAKIHIKMSHYEDAIQSFNWVILSELKKQQWADPKTYTQIGYCQLMLKKYDTAIESLSIYIQAKNMPDSCIDDKTTYSIAHKLRAKAYRSTKNDEQTINNKQAITDYEIALQYNEQDAEAVSELVALYRENQDDIKVLEKLDHAIKHQLAPLTIFFEQRALVYFDFDLIEAGILDYAICLRREPTNMDLRLRYVNALLELPDQKDNTILKQALRQILRMSCFSEVIQSQTKIRLQELNIIDEKKDSKDNFKLCSLYYDQGINYLEYGLQLLNQKNKSKETINALKQAKKEFLKSQKLEGKVDRELAIISFHLKNYTESICHFNAVAELDELNYLQRGICFYREHIQHNTPYYLNMAIGNFLKGFKSLIITVYKKNNQTQPTSNTEETKKIHELIQALKKNPELLEEYFFTDLNRWKIFKEAFESFEAIEKINNIAKTPKTDDSKSLAMMPYKGFFNLIDSKLPSKKVFDEIINADGMQIKSQTSRG